MLQGIPYTIGANSRHSRVVIGGLGEVVIDHDRPDPHGLEIEVATVWLAHQHIIACELSECCSAHGARVSAQGCGRGGATGGETMPTTEASGGNSATSTSQLGHKSLFKATSPADRYAVGRSGCISLDESKCNSASYMQRLRCHSRWPLLICIEPTGTGSTTTPSSATTIIRWLSIDTCKTQVAKHVLLVVGKLCCDLLTFSTLQSS